MDARKTCNVFVENENFGRGSNVPHGERESQSDQGGSSMLFLASPFARACFLPECCYCARRAGNCMHMG